MIAIPCADAATQQAPTEWTDYASLTEEEKASLYLPVLQSVRVLALEAWGAPANWAATCGTTAEEERLRIEVADSLMAPMVTGRRISQPSPDSAASKAVLPAPVLAQAVRMGWIDGVVPRAPLRGDSVSTAMGFTLALPRAAEDTIVVTVRMARSHACPGIRRRARGFAAVFDLQLVRRAGRWEVVGRRPIAIT
jgi:hypothetical protein